MFDRVDAREDRFADRLRAVRVRGDLVPGGMRDLDDGRDLFRRHLGRAGHAAVGQHRAGGDHLEEVRAAVDRVLRIAREIARVRVTRPCARVPECPLPARRGSTGRRRRAGS